MRRVGIVSFGAVTPLGVGIERLDQGLRQGQRAIGKVGYIAPRQKNLVGLAPKPYFDHPLRSRQMLRSAITEALTGQVRDNCGLIVSTVAGDSDALERLLSPFHPESVLDDENAANSAWSVFRSDDAAQAIAHELGLNGPRLCLSNACASGNVALGVALDWIRNRVVDCVLVAGVDVVKASTLWAAEASGFIGRNLQPFDEARNGTILGEGAGAVLLVADDGSSPVRGWLDGFGCVCDRGAAAITLSEDGGGLSRAMVAALNDAGAEAAAIDLVSAHAPGTRGIDAIECRAIAASIPQPRLSVAATKSITTHLSGASAIVEAIAACLQMEGHYVHGNVGLSSRGQDIALPVVGPRRTDAQVRSVLSNACGGGGTNTSVVLRRSDQIWHPSAESPRAVAITAVARILGEPGARIAIEPFEADLSSDYCRVSRAARIAAEAARRLLRAAGGVHAESNQVAVIGGTALGGAVEAQSVLMDAFKREPCYVLPSEALGHGTHYGASLIARENEFNGYTVTVNGSELAGIKALAIAADCVANGRAQAAICIAYDTAELPFDGCPTYPENTQEGAIAFLIEPWNVQEVQGRSLGTYTFSWNFAEASHYGEALGLTTGGLATGPANVLAEALEKNEPFLLQFADPPNSTWQFKLT